MASDFLDVPRAFVRVYRLPEKLTDGYCFGHGVTIAFQNVDWFESPLVGEGSSRDELIGFIKNKRYYHAGARFLVLGDHPNLTFTIDPVAAGAAS